MSAPSEMSAQAHGERSGATTPAGDEVVVDVPLPTTEDIRNKYKEYLKVSEALEGKIREVIELIERIGDKESEALAQGFEDTGKSIFELRPALENGIVTTKSNLITLWEEMSDSMQQVGIKFTILNKLLVHQTQTFPSFNHLKSALEDHRKELLLSIISTKETLSRESSFEEALANALTKLTEIFGEVTDDLLYLSKTTLPRFIREEKDRATTRFLTLTTIATFFSSITAIMLGFSYNPATSGHSRPTLNNAVNLCWFLSLIFSISSGVNSLLSIIWRNATVYATDIPLPRFHHLWINHAPMLFLGVSALFFIVGLNVLAYSSPLPNFIAIATTTVTVLHFLGLLIIVPWFMFRLRGPRTGSKALDV